MYNSRSHVTYQTCDHADLDSTSTFDLQWQSIFFYFNKFYMLRKELDKICGQNFHRYLKDVQRFS